MYIFDKNTIQKRRERVKKAFENQLPNDALALFFSGEPITRPGGFDQTYPFLPHPEYYWISGLRRPWGVVAYSKAEGFTDFIQPITYDEVLWEGASGDLEGQNISELESWISKKNFKEVYIFGEMNEKPISLPKRATHEKFLDLKEALNLVRRVKDSQEVEMVRKCAKASLAGYEVLEKFIKAGVTEREIQIAYETAVQKAGADKLPYDTIVGAGVNAAILHAIPTKKVVGSDELVLIDAGADIEDYCVDITRVFSAKGKFSDQQQAIYDTVLKAQSKCISMCTPGTQWRDIHNEAGLVMAQGLKSLNILNCSPEAALETGAISVFFPHGVGHLVGLRVRDVGGVANKPVQKYNGVNLRVDFSLQENYLMTVEPGLYFVKALIEKKDIREKHQKNINWNEVEKWRSVGGVRIEDDILVGKTPQNLTEIVKK